MNVRQHGQLGQHLGQVTFLIFHLLFLISHSSFLI